MDTTELQNLLVFTKKSFTQGKETSFVEHMWKRPLFQSPPKTHQQPRNSTTSLWRQIYTLRRFTDLEGAETKCSSHQSSAVRRFSHLCTAENSEEIPEPSLTHGHSSKGHAVLLALDPSCNDPVQIPRAVLGHVPAFVCTSAIGMQGKETAFCGQLSGAVAIVCVRAPE